MLLTLDILHIEAHIIRRREGIPVLTSLRLHSLALLPEGQILLFRGVLLRELLDTLPVTPPGR